MTENFITKTGDGRVSTLRSGGEILRKNLKKNKMKIWFFSFTIYCLLRPQSYVCAYNKDLSAQISELPVP